MKKKMKKLTAEFWERDRKTREEMKAYIAELERRIAERKNREQSA